MVSRETDPAVLVPGNITTPETPIYWTQGLWLWIALDESQQILMVQFLSLQSFYRPLPFCSYSRPQVHVIIAGDERQYSLGVKSLGF